MATLDLTLAPRAIDHDGTTFAVLIPMNRPADYVLGRSIFVKQQKDDLKIPVITSNERSTYRTGPGSDSGEYVYQKLPCNSGDIDTEARFTAILNHPQSDWCMGRAAGMMRPVDQAESTSSQNHIVNDFHIDHAYIVVGMHPVSGLMTVSSEHRRTIHVREGGRCSELPPGKTHTFVHTRNEFEVGILKFALVYPRPSGQAQFEKLIRNRLLYLNALYGRIRQNSTVLLKSLYPLETGCYMIKNFYACKLAARGQNTTILVAINKATGTCVAVKCYELDSADQKCKYFWEVDCLQRLKNDRGFLRILDAGDSDVALSIGSNNEDFKVKWYLAMPLLVSTFGKYYPWDNLSVKTRWQLWRSSAQALSNLHARSIIHRHITLEKMGILSLNPVQAVIIGFGSAINSPSSEQSPAPKVLWAPEMIKLARGEASTPYDEKVDVWSWGLAFLGGFGFFPSREDTWLSEQDLQRMQDCIAALSTPFSTFISRIMQEDPNVRPCATAVYEDPFWVNLEI